MKNEIGNQAPYESDHSAALYRFTGTYNFPRKGVFQASVGFGFEGIAEKISTDVDFGAPIGTRRFDEETFTPGITANTSIDVQIAKQLSMGSTVGTSVYFGKDGNKTATTASFDISYSF